MGPPHTTQFMVVLREGSRRNEGRGARSKELEILVFEEDTPVRSVCEKFQDLFRFGAQNPPTGLQLKFNLLGNYLGGRAIGDVAPRRNVGQFHGCILGGNVDRKLQKTGETGLGSELG